MVSYEHPTYNIPETKHLIFLLKLAPHSSFSITMHGIIFSSFAQTKNIEVIIGFSLLYIYKQSINRFFWLHFKNLFFI